MLAALCHTEKGGWEQLDDLSRISDLIAEPGCLVWARASVHDITPADIETITQEVGLHPLAVEDATHLRQRPKLEAYENHLFAVMHQLDEVDGQLEARQIACFIGASWVLTLHDSSERTLEEAMNRCLKGEKAADQGPSFVMHAILDAIVDDYGAFADRLEDEIEDLEEQALDHPGAGLQTTLYSVKQRLSRIRRYLIPGERLLATVAEARGPLIAQRTAAHFRDVHDHALRILDQIRSVEDLSNAVIDLQRAEQTQTLNEATKRLSGWAAIIAVPTFIASVYGMNFELVPRSGRIFGFWFALGLMIGTGVSLYSWFKRRGWI